MTLYFVQSLPEGNLGSCSSFRVHKMALHVSMQILIGPLNKPIFHGTRWVVILMGLVPSTRADWQ